MRNAGVFIVTVVVLAAIAGPWLVQFDPSAQELALRLEGPSTLHWFGLDELGRDILSRVLSGARVSLVVGLVVVSVSALIGAAVGSIAGYYGGIVDEAISRFIDILLAFPGLLLAIALVAVLGPSLTNVVLALTSIGWVGYARVVRAQVLQAREFEYVVAAHAIGAATPRILIRHILPAAFPALTVQATLGMGGAILSEAALSFLGLGVQPPTPSWGAMINYGRVHVLDAPHLTVFPGLAIAVVVLGLNLLGDGLRDSVEERSGGSKGPPLRYQRARRASLPLPARTTSGRVDAQRTQDT
jgi:peptide/nickel transport system permease protein